jgi:hypothetical protein
MSQYLIYVDAVELSDIDGLLSVGAENYKINEYFPLTEDGKPLLINGVGGYGWTNSLASRCAMLTEANTDVIPKANIKNWLGSDIQDSKLILELLDDLINGRYTIENFKLDVSEYGDN